MQYENLPDIPSEPVPQSVSPTIPAHQRLANKLSGAMMRGYQGMYLPKDLKDKLDRNYEEAFEKHYNTEQELARRAQQ